jgi:hypothetical protein
MWSCTYGVRHVHDGGFGCWSWTLYVEHVVHVSDVAAPRIPRRQAA